MTPVVLEGFGYRLAVAPQFGGNLLGACWRSDDGSEVALLRACDPAMLRPGAPSPVGCFPMVPFANRIDAGRFRFAGEAFQLTVDRPEEHVAVHGLSRFAPFEVVAASRTRTLLVHRHRGPVFAYDLEQALSVGPQGVAIDLQVTNRGRRMPYGIGLHPFLVREEDARLRFAAAARFLSDARHLPVRLTSEGPDFGAGALLAGLEGFDAHYIGWETRHARLERPAAGIAVTVSAHGALTNLHVYVPPDGGLVCLEPVSHVPDVHNRRRFAEAGDLAVLESGKTLEGGARIAVAPGLPRDAASHRD